MCGPTNTVVICQKQITDLSMKRHRPRWKKLFMSLLEKKKNQKFHIRHSNDFILLIMENGGSDQLSAKYCNRYEIIIITEMVISIFRTFE